jgi:hypothetical protein
MRRTQEAKRLDFSSQNTLHFRYNNATVGLRPWHGRHDPIIAPLTRRMRIRRRGIPILSERLVQRHGAHFRARLQADPRIDRVLLEHGLRDGDLARPARPRAVPAVT